MTQAKSAPAATSKEVAEPRPHEKLVKELATLAQLDNANGEAGFEIAARVVDDIMSANTLEELFDASDSGLTSLKGSNYIGRPIGFVDVKWNKGDEKYKGGLGAYAVADIITQDGEVDTVSCGAPNVVAFLRRAQTLGLVKDESPLWVVIRSKETENGELLTVTKP